MTQKKITGVQVDGADVTTVLSAFTSGAQGVAPASGGGTTNYLRADGTWAAPTSGGTPGGASTNIQYNTSGAFNGNGYFTYTAPLGVHTLTLGGISIASTGAGYSPAQIIGANDASIPVGLDFIAGNLTSGSGLGSELTLSASIISNTGGSATLKGGDGGSGTGGAISVGGGTTTNGGTVTIGSGHGTASGTILFKIDTTNAFQIGSGLDWSINGSTGTSGQVLTSAGSGAAPTWSTPASGTVTSVSVVSANGFAGSSSGGATPALTISTSITGMLKGNGTAISAGTAGTDYSIGTSALATGILKSTTSTGALSIAGATDFPALYQGWLVPCRAATTTNITLSGNVVIDGITTAPGDRILVKNQTTASDNGIYVAASGAWALASDNPSTIGACTTIQFGTVGSGTVYQKSSSTAWTQIGDQILLATAGSTGLTLTASSMLGALATRMSGRGNQTETLTLAGTLLETNGGTNQTTYTTGDILYASGTNTLSKLGVGSTNQVLTVAGGVPSWATPSSGGTSYTLRPVRVATTANGTLASSFANGQTVDGITLATGDRILLKNQTTQTDNGVYTVNASGAPTRVTEFTTGASTLTGGVLIPVISGTVNGGSTFQCMNTGSITIGSTSIIFGPLNGIQGYGVSSWTMPVNSSSSVYGLAIGNAANATNTSAICIGRGTASGYGSIVLNAGVGGAATASGDFAVSIGSAGTGSTADVQIGQMGSNSFGTYNVAIGRSNSAASYGVGNVLLGYRNNDLNSKNYSIAVGYGAAVTADAVQAYGYGAYPDFAGEITFGSGSFASSLGKAKISILPLWMQTTTATAAELASGAGTDTNTPTSYIALTNNSTYIFDIDVVARKSTAGTDYSAWNLKFCINREANAASTALVGSVTKTLIGQTSGATSGAWDVAVTADTTNGRPAIKVTGQASTTIRWVANVRMTKVAG